MQIHRATFTPKGVRSNYITLVTLHQFGYEQFSQFGSIRFVITVIHKCTTLWGKHKLSKSHQNLIKIEVTKIEVIKIEVIKIEVIKIEVINVVSNPTNNKLKIALLFQDKLKLQYKNISEKIDAEF